MELNYKTLDTELAAALETLPFGSLELTRENIAPMRDAMRNNAPPPAIPDDVTVTPQTIHNGDVEVPLFIYRRAGSDAAQPCLLWIHGGGYILGSAEDDRAGIIASELGCTVVSVDYRLAPEHPFPAGPEDCYAALQWVASNAEELNIDATRLAIGGASAGSGMAAGLALMNRDRGGPQLALQLLLYPMIDNLHDTLSGQYNNHPIWNQAMSFRAWEMYLDGEPGHQASPYAAASRATDLSNLPPAYICVGGCDLFRDEDIDYARRLTAAGVPCDLAVYAGMYHGADSFVPQAALSKRLNQGVLDALAQYLGQ